MKAIGAISLFLAACAPVPVTVVPVVSKDFCAQASLITLDRRDKMQPETANQIIRHNEYGISHCGWKRPK